MPRNIYQAFQEKRNRKKNFTEYRTEYRGHMNGHGHERKSAEDAEKWRKINIE